MKEVYCNVWSMILSLQLMNSIIRQNSLMRCDRPIYPILSQGLGLVLSLYCN